MELPIFKSDDVVEYRRLYSQMKYTGRIVKEIEYPIYEIEVLKCDNNKLVGDIQNVNFEKGYQVELLSVKKFDTNIAEYEAEKYLRLCHEAVDRNDEKWFNECHAQFVYWSSQVGVQA